LSLQPDAPKNPRAIAEALLKILPDTGMVGETSLAGEDQLPGWPVLMLLLV
jgi:hypothetical protein